MRALVAFHRISSGQPASPSRNRRRGTTLVEVLVASAVMAILMVGVLQVYSLALITNQGSAARTDLTYRAQQVIENLRMIQYFAKNGNTDPAGSTRFDVTTISSTTGTFSISPTGAPTGTPAVAPSVTISNTNSAWQEAGVVGGASDPFRISYSVTDLAGTAGAPSWADTFYLVIVTATPVNAPGATVPTGAQLYQGGDATSRKQVTYAAQILR
jgi:prepilin-type N-terminal cleavage/methylation domain-containing protein